MLTKIVVRDVYDAFHGRDASIYTCRDRVSASHTCGQELPLALQQGGPHVCSHQLRGEELGKRSEGRWSSALLLFPLYALPRVTPPPLLPSLVKGQGA